MLKRTLSLAEASSHFSQWRIQLSEVNNDVVYRPGLSHQAASAFSWERTTVEACRPIEEALPEMLVVSLLKEDEKVCTKTTGVIEDYNHNGSNFIAPGQLAVCSMATFKTRLEYNFTNIGRTVCRTGPRRIMPTSCKHCPDAQLVIIEWKTWNLSLHCPAWWRCTNCGDKISPLTPLLLRSLPKPGRHRGECGMYDKMRCELYWLLKANPPKRQSVAAEIEPETMLDWRGNFSKKCFPKHALEIQRQGYTGRAAKTTIGNQFIFIFINIGSFLGKSRHCKPIRRMLCLFLDWSLDRALKHSPFSSFEQSSAVRKQVLWGVTYVTPGKTTYDNCTSSSS